MSDFLSKLLEILHLKKSTGRRMAEMEKNLRGSKSGNEDRLQDLKAEIRRLEAQAVQKKKEFDEARGDSKQVVAGEIEHVIRERNKLRDRGKIISSNIERLATALAKIEEWKAAKASGIQSGDIDDIAVEVQDKFDDLAISDSAARDLDRVGYKAPERERVDVERETTSMKEPQKAADVLPPDILKDLKELETG